MKAIILDTAERSLARLFGFHLDEARVLIRELVQEAHATASPRHRADTAIWRASSRWHRARLVVQHVGDGVRVLEVLPPYAGWTAPPRAGVPLGDRSSSTTAPSRGPSSLSAHAAPAPATSAAPPPALGAEATLVLAAALEPWRRGGPFPGYAELGRLTGLPRAVVAEAVNRLEAYAGAPLARTQSHVPRAPRPAPASPEPPKERRRSSPASARLATRLGALGLRISGWEVRYGLNAEERRIARDWAAAREKGARERVPLALQRYQP